MVTLTQIKASILDLTEMTPSAYAVDAQLTLYINSSLSRVYDLLVKHFEHYFMAYADITLSTSTDAFALPADFYKLVKVVYIAADGTWNPLNLISIHNIDEHHVGGYTPGSNADLGYMLWSAYTAPSWASQIKFSANPVSTSGTMRVFYVPVLADLVAGSDVVRWVCPANWVDFVIFDVAAMMLAKEESDTSFFVGMREQVKTDIIKSSKNRNAGDASCMALVE